MFGKAAVNEGKDWDKVLKPTKKYLNWFLPHWAAVWKIPEGSPRCLHKENWEASERSSERMYFPISCPSRKS